jgi:predicted O-methyltransferase YrrM
MSIVSEEIQDYLRELQPFPCPVLQRLEQEGNNEGIPNIVHATAQTLRSFMRVANPRKILELGTAIGYSAIHMAQAAPMADVFTIEKDPERAERAKRNVEEAGLSERIHIWTGDALEIMPTLKSSYDVIFIDAAKGKYQIFLDLAVQLCRDGGMILTDNVLFRGFVAGRMKPTKPAHLKLTEKMQAYNVYLCQHPALETSILPVGDGLAVSIKKATDPDGAGF